ncbi:small-conductance mechanosensitive channel [Lewinella marina]|uniref:Transporter n=1 Tax=Neolewinella marina TaxID=438751 RepID=A0A2G0CAT7_9BACT|nr:mechanosensitive ion channel domain-containing protein [Neolewinella marina]NJB87190.1 small-conductance mechanosensitive channel [Neolewinella marina]PHK97085.1 transporter [Neolewinella marina]
MDNLWQQLTEWGRAYLVPGNLVIFLLLIVAILVTIQWMRRQVKQRVANTGVRYKSQKAIEIFGYLLIILLSLSYFTGTIKNFGVIVGLLTAGITITLQELILSVAGSFYIFFVKVYKPGDRIEINGIKGDVIDIDSIYTTMMEIGQWVSSDNYSGRIVKLSNAFVFRGPIYNYSQDFPFVWDELNVPVRHGSDLVAAREIIQRSADEKLGEYVAASTREWKEVVNKYYIENARVVPTVALTITDNWNEFNLRYIVDYRLRRGVKQDLFTAIQREIAATGGRVELASATVELTGQSSLRVRTEAFRPPCSPE